MAYLADQHPHAVPAPPRPAPAGPTRPDADIPVLQQRDLSARRQAVQPAAVLRPGQTRVQVLSGVAHQVWSRCVEGGPGTTAPSPPPHPHADAALPIQRPFWHLRPAMSAVVTQGGPHLGPVPPAVAPDPPPDVLLALLSRNKALEGTSDTPVLTPVFRGP